MGHYIVVYNTDEPQLQLNYVGPIEAVSPQAALDSLKNENYSYGNVFPIALDEDGQCEYWTIEELQS